MPITNISKTAGAASMECGGAVDINLAVAAAPGAATQRVAIALILDRSGSMAGTPMLHLKAGAKEFVNIITDANAQSGGSMYEMGLISFAAEATTDVPLTGNIQTMNAAIEGLEAKGNTNQAGAFQQAGAMLQGFDGKKVAVMFTDGMPTVGGDPAPQADELTAGGVEIFCIGLRGSDGLDEDTLRAWVSPPPEDHVLLAPTASELEEAFETLARELLEAGARNVVVRDILGPQFTVLSVEQPSVGWAEAQDARTVVWRMDELAANAPQTAVLRIVALHTGEGNGNLALNEAATLTADGGVSMQFAPLTVYVDCGEPAGEIWPEPCVPAACVCTSAGGGVVTADVGTVSMAGTGGLLMINARLKNVCPGKRILLGVWVTRETPDGCQMCGFKSYELQPNTGTVVRDIVVKGLRFLLPPPEPESCSCGDSQCYQVYAAAQAVDEGACPCIPQVL